VKILFILQLNLRKHGSFEDLLLGLAKETERRGHRAAFIVTGVEVPEIGATLRKFATVHVVPGHWQRAASVVQLTRLLVRERPDAVNLHFCDTLWLLPLLLFARALGARVITHYHGEIRPLGDVPAYQRSLSMLRLQSVVVDRIVTVSEANRRFLRHLRVAAPIDVVYNGVDLDRFRPTPPSAADLVALGLPLGAPYLVYVGSLISRKRIDVLLEAFTRVHATAPDLQLVLVGGGEIDAARAKARALGVADSVHLLGLAADYPMALVSGALAMVSASVQESFGLLFAEAMALSVPAVACRVGGVPEVVIHEKVGLLAEPDDVSSLANQIDRIVNDRQLRNRMAAQTRAHAAASFSLADRIPELLDIFTGPERRAPSRSSIGPSSKRAASL
jgi:glycosyltransferase involved in cell wall biosynthesis